MMRSLKPSRVLTISVSFFMMVRMRKPIPVAVFKEVVALPDDNEGHMGLGGAEL